MALLTRINNPFNHLDRDTNTVDSGLPIHFYLHDSQDDIEFVVSVNGLIVEDYGYILKNNDSLAFVAIPKGDGGGGKSILRTVALVALAVVAPQIAVGQFGLVAGSAAAGFASAGIVIAGGLLLNAIMPLPSPSLGTGNNDLQNVSPTYAFSGGSNARQAGTALPLVFGTVRVVPPIIGSYLSLDGDKQYLNILMAVNDGLVESITDVQINNQAVTNFNDVIVNSNKGENDQAPLGNFRDTSTTFALQRGLNEFNSTTTYSTLGNTIDELEIVMSLPQGLFSIADNGDYNENEIQFTIEYRKVGDSSFTYLQGNSQDYQYFYNRYQWVLVAKPADSESENPYYRVRTFIDVVEFGNDRGSSFDENGSSYEFKEKILSTTVGNVITLNTTFKTTRRLSYVVKNLSRGQYEVKVTRLTAFDSNTRVANSLSLDYINEVVYDDFTYPNVALLSINAMATDQLSGNYPTVSCLVSKIGTIKPLNNPAWACRLILILNGVAETDIDESKFADWASYCDSKNLECNLYIDQQMPMYDALNMISLLGRGKVVQFGSIFSPIIERAVAFPTQSFLFTSGNTSDFSLDYITYTDRSNVVEVTYYDETDDYKSKTVQSQSFDFDTTTSEIKSSINLYGCTNEQQALKYSQALLNTNRYISETVKFTASVDAIACTIGDVIEVGRTHMSNTIADGRVASSTVTTITLDTEVTLKADVLYEVTYRLQNDNLVTLDVDIVSVETTTDTLTLSTMATAPSRLDVYAFGQQDVKATNYYRVTGISKRSDFTRTISAIEYNIDVYNDDNIINVEPVLPLDTTPTNLQITENIVKNKDKSISEIITLSWVGASGLSSSIYVDDVLFGTTDQHFFTIKDQLINNTTYEFRVGNTSVNYTFLGLFAPPEAPTNLRVMQNDNLVALAWNKSSSIDANGYEIRSGVTWETGFTIGQVGDVNVFEWYPDMNNNYRFWVKTIDTSGVYSKEAVNVQFNVTNVDEGLNVIIDEDLLDVDAPQAGTTNGLVFVLGKGYIPFETATWAEIEASTWNSLSALQWIGEPSFTSDTIDTTKVGLTKIRILRAFEAILSNPTWAKLQNRTWLSMADDTWNNITSNDVTLKVTYSISDDDITYSAFIEYTGIVDESFRYIKFKYEIIGDLSGQELTMSDFRVIMDVPDIEFIISDKIITIDETITYTDYTYDFYQAPRVIPVSKDSLNLGVISAITKDTFHIDSFNSSGGASTGKYDFIIQGY